MSSSVSAAAASTLTLSKLREQRASNSYQLGQMIQQRIDFHTTVIAENLAYNKQSEKVLQGAPREIVCSADTLASPKYAVKFARREFNSYANEVHLKFRDKWNELQKAESDEIQVESFTKGVESLSSYLINKVPVCQGGVVPVGSQLDENSRFIVSKYEGKVPETRKLSVPHKRILRPATKADLTKLGEAMDAVEAEFHQFCKVCIIAVFSESPGDWCLMPQSLTFRPLEEEEDALHAVEPRIDYEIIHTDGNVSTVILVSEKAAEILKKVIQEEQDLLKQALKRVAISLAYQKKIDEINASSVPQKAVISSEVLSLNNAFARAKPKKGKQPLAASLDDDNDVMPAAPAVVKVPVIEKSQVQLKDPNDLHTFRALLKLHTDAISWNDAVHCMRALGFEVTRQSGSNTWKFAYKNKAWERNEKTYDEQFVPQEAGTSSRAFHVPHHGDLTKRGQLDDGRLSSFKKLLEECLFDASSVTLN